MYPLATNVLQKRHLDGFEAAVSSGRDRLLSGRLDLHRDGFGFVRSDTPTSGRTDDIFIPPNEINGAMQGDLVLVDEAPPARDGRRSGRVRPRVNPQEPYCCRNLPLRASASPLRSPAPAGNYVTPLDERITGSIYIPDGNEVIPDGPETPHRMLGDEARQIHHQTPANPDMPLEGLAVDVELTAFPTFGRPAPWKAHRSSWTAGRFRCRRGNHHPQAPYPAYVSRWGTCRGHRPLT